MVWSAKNRPPRNTASEVAAGLEIVPVGTSNHMKSTDDIVGDAVHVPLKVKGTVEVAKDEDADEKGNTPLPGIEMEDEVADPLSAEVNVLGDDTVGFEADELEVELLELLELI